jgi:hypothetical protein
MLRFKGLLAASGLILAGCVGDEFLVGAGGNDGAGGGSTGSGSSVASSAGTDAGSSGSATSTGSGGCAGCLQGDACQAGTAVDACGAAAATCQVCETTQLCQTASCNGGACGTTPANDGDPCPFVPGDETSGQCVTGQCLEAPEDCLNGVDDDEDGNADCLDSDCDVAFTCVTDTPVGWSGPFAVYEGAVECPGVWGIVVPGTFGREPTAGGYDCACTATVTGCEVTFALGEAAAEGSCVGDADPFTVPAGGCTDLGDPTALTFALLATRTGDVECVGDTAASVELPPPSFDEVFTICDAPDPDGGVGCDAGACRPRVPDSGNAQGDICIMRPTDDPEGDTCIAPFTSKRVIGSAFDDTRDCDCECTSAACGGDVIGFFDEATCAECGGNEGPCDELEVGITKECASQLPEAGDLFAGAPTPTYDTADVPNGTLEAGGLQTVCCLP